MTDIEFVVAWYKEDLSWIGTTPGITGRGRVTVYAKNEDVAAARAAWPDAIPLPNQGREAQTYLHHILTRYHNLAEVTVFMQGDPFAHFLLNGVYNRLPREEALTLLTSLRYERTEPFATRYIHADDFANTPCEQIFGFSPPMIHFTPGAQWVVRREDILARPRAFYQRLQDCMSEDFFLRGNQDAHMPDSINPFTLERLWGLIFTASIPAHPSFMMPPGSLSETESPAS